MGLHGRVQASDIVVMARVVDPALALVNVERVLKGDAPKQITLVGFVDGFAIPAQRKLLVGGARELMFLVKKGDAYALVEDQYGRMAVNGDELVDSFRAQPRILSQTLASIQRLVALQARAARSDAEADAAYVAALKSSDIELQMWALWRPKIESRCHLPRWLMLSLTRGRRPRKSVLCWVGGMQRVWWPTPWWPGGSNERHRSSPRFSRLPQAAMSVLGPRWRWVARNRTYLPVLRRVAAGDAHAEARALAYTGIMYVLGPESLGDLRLGAKDSDDQVRARAVVDAITCLNSGILNHVGPLPRMPSSPKFARS